MIDRIPITSREQWLKARKQDVTASVAAALFGAHPYTSALEIALEKTGKSEQQLETKAMRRGTLLEDDALEIIALDNPSWQIMPCTGTCAEYYRDSVLRIGATPDAFAIRPDKEGTGIIQVKTADSLSFSRTWDQDGVITPPLYAIIQAIVEAKLTGCKWACVAVLVLNSDLDTHVIDIDLHDPLWQALCRKVAEFWQIVDAGELPPADYTKDGELIASFYPQDNGLEIDLSSDNRLPELVDELTAIRAIKSEHAKREPAIKAEILDKMGENTRARLADGRIITAKAVKKSAYQVKAQSTRQIRIKGESL